MQRRIDRVVRLHVALSLVRQVESSFLVEWEELRAGIDTGSLDAHGKDEPIVLPAPKRLTSNVCAFRRVQPATRQIFDDPAGDHEWGTSATIDLAASDEVGEAVLTVTGIDRL